MRSSRRETRKVAHIYLAWQPKKNRHPRSDTCCFYQLRTTIHHTRVTLNRCVSRNSLTIKCNVCCNEGVWISTQLQLMLLEKCERHKEGSYVMRVSLKVLFVCKTFLLGQENLPWQWFLNLLLQLLLQTITLLVKCSRDDDPESSMWSSSSVCVKDSPLSFMLSSDAVFFKEWKETWIGRYDLQKSTFTVIHRFHFQLDFWSVLVVFPYKSIFSRESFDSWSLVSLKYFQSSSSRAHRSNWSYKFLSFPFSCSVFANGPKTSVFSFRNRITS